MTSPYAALLERVKTLQDLGMIESVLGWDQQTAMPVGGSAARARQMATLSRLRHELFTSEETGKLIEMAERDIQGMSYESDEASLVRVFKEDYADATKFPTDFVASYTELVANAHQIWAEARANNDFKHFQPTLEKLVDYALRAAEYLGYQDHPYDALLGQYERGMTSAQVKTIFDAHKPALVDLIAAISEVSDRVNDGILHQAFDIEKQREFGLMVIKAFGFDFNRGAQAISVHPFCTHFSRDDVRITTRFDPNFLNPALFGMMHEAGHGMYEQGIAAQLEGTVLASGTSLAVHESQSRMWENMVGRSKGFWSWALPLLKQRFPSLDNVSLDTFYAAINKVQPSFIRVEADEATYNLHIMIRFELEMSILNREVAVADLPTRWNDLYEAYLGIRPPTDTLGVLQDVHWSAGLMGYFPTYALGNLLAAQYYKKAIQDHPSIPDEIANGKFDTLLGWLNRNIHQHGRKFTSDELTRQITGESIQSADYIQYLQAKFGDIYHLA